MCTCGFLQTHINTVYNIAKWFFYFDKAQYERKKNIHTIEINKNIKIKVSSSDKA